MISPGKSVRLFLADGTPGGLLTAEIMNWTGHIVAAPRSDLAALMKRPEASRTGMYLLLGDDPESVGGTIAYIGEADDISKRLYQHSRPEQQGGKDFWDRAIVLTSKDANLTKAHARYLESRLIDMAQRANRARLINGTAPPPISLPEADRSDMEFFIEQAKIVLPVLGINVFRATIQVSSAGIAGATLPAGEANASPIFEMRIAKDGIQAAAQEIDGEFTVLAGSTARLSWVNDAYTGYQSLRDKLEIDGTLAVSPDGQSMYFTHDQVVPSPSAAAAVVAGSQRNGRRDWRIRGTNMTYDEWQNQHIESSLKTGGP